MRTYGNMWHQNQISSKVKVGYAGIAQLVERSSYTRLVVGSSPTARTWFIIEKRATDIVARFVAHYQSKLFACLMIPRTLHGRSVATLPRKIDEAPALL